MRARVLVKQGEPLRALELPAAVCGPSQVRLAVRACGVCRTDLHIRDGELARPKLPLVLGHQIVGEVIELGKSVRGVRLGNRRGVPWLAWTCGHCRQCLAARENLCENARFTGYTVNGGFADEAVVEAAYSFALPERYSDVAAAPLLCAGLIGHRALRLAGEGERVGLYGFGASAHLVAQLALFQGRRVYAFTRPGDAEGQRLARQLGAVWAGDASAAPPEPLDAAIIFAPVGELVPTALAAVCPGGTVVCAGIHMSDIPSFPYELLWGERTLRSVANLERRDGEELLALAPRAGLLPHVETFPFEQAEQALAALRAGRIDGAAVLTLAG